MNERVDTLIFNSINFSAISISFMGVEQVLTVLVLVTALLYNIQKLRND